MEEIKQIIDDVAQGHKPNEQLQSVILDKVQDALDVKKAEIASQVYNQPEADKN